MSTEAVPRVGQVGTVFTAIVDEPVPNTNPVTYNIVDLSGEDGNCKIEFMRPDKSRFTMPGTVLSPKTNGAIQYIDTLGILNQAGLWRFRGIPSLLSSLKFPGSWYEQRVGD